MKLKPRTGHVTFRDFCFLVNNDQKADLIDGVIYMASPDNTDANELFAWLLTVMRLFVKARDLGKVFGSRVALRLDNKNGPEPDLLFIKKARQYLIKRGHIAGAADLAIEIVSPDSIERDYNKKRRQYQRAGVPEYWIIDELEKRVTLLRLGPDGVYREVRVRKGELHSQAMPGFWIRPEWLWQKPLPDELETLRQIMAG